MKSILIILFLNLSFFAFIQPEIKFDTTAFDYGQITEGGRIKKDFQFTNVGNEPLIITRASTGDGGSYADFPKEPIFPNEKGMITFHYDSRRIGRFQRTIRVQSNAKTPNNVFIRVKGEVIRRRTTIEISEKVIDIGTINYGDVETISYEVRNVGMERLYLSFDRWKYPEIDLFYCQMEKAGITESTDNKSYYEPNETVKVTFALRNVYGETGDFERSFRFIYNSYDTTTIKIKGRFIGKPKREKVYESNCVLIYTDGKLAKKMSYSGYGKAQREDYFEGSYCVHTIIQSYNRTVTERFYRKGEMVEEKVIKE